MTITAETKLRLLSLFPTLENIYLNMFMIMAVTRSISVESEQRSILNLQSDNCSFVHHLEQIFHLCTEKNITEGHELKDSEQI